MKSRSVNAKQKDDDKIEMTNEMAKEIIECVSLPSKHPVLFEHFHRQAREDYSLTEEESKEYQWKKSSKEIWSKLSTHFK